MPAMEVPSSRSRPRAGVSRLALAALCAFSVVLAQCSGSGGTGKTVPKGASASGTPSPTPSTSPAGSPSPTPTPSGAGVTSCTAPAVTAGIFTSIETTGAVTGTTYTDNGTGSWEAIQYSPASPSPSPTATTSATPSPTPTASVSPAPTSTPITVTEYFGEYTVMSYNGNITGGGLYTAAATNGCFAMIEQQGAVAMAHRRAQPLQVPSPNAFADGEPNEPGTEAETFLDEGTITTLTITNLTATTGSGSFSFTDSADNTATGTITITGSETLTESPDDRRRFGFVRSGRTR